MAAGHRRAWSRRTLQLELQTKETQLYLSAILTQTVEHALPVLGEELLRGEDEDVEPGQHLPRPGRGGGVLVAAAGGGEAPRQQTAHLLQLQAVVPPLLHLNNSIDRFVHFK